MKVKDLRKQLEGVPDTASVWIAVDKGDIISFVDADGETSGYSEMGEPCDIEGNPIEEMKTSVCVAFCIYPEGLVKIGD